MERAHGNHDRSSLVSTEARSRWARRDVPYDDALSINRIGSRRFLCGRRGADASFGYWAPIARRWTRANCQAAAGFNEGPLWVSDAGTPSAATHYHRHQRPLWPCARNTLEERLA